MGILTFAHILEYDKNIAIHNYKEDITWQIAIDLLEVNEEIERPFNRKNTYWSEFFEFIDDNGFDVKYTPISGDLYRVKIKPKNIEVT